MFWLSEKLKSLDSFDKIFALTGKVYRQVAQRKTFRTVYEGKEYFVKLHYGIGWFEFFKNIVVGRIPVFDAEEEFKAIKACEAANILTMTAVGCGIQGLNPITRRSFLITEAITQALSLEDFVHHGEWAQLTWQARRHLIKRVATIAGHMHAAGLNHRDFYLGHFLWQQSTDKLFLIDLHRMQQRTIVPQRWLLKDLAGLLFSAQACWLSLSEQRYFVYHYCLAKTDRGLLSNKQFWQQVVKKAGVLCAKHQ